MEAYSYITEIVITVERSLNKQMEAINNQQLESFSKSGDFTCAKTCAMRAKKNGNYS